MALQFQNFKLDLHSLKLSKILLFFVELYKDPSAGQFISFAICWVTTLENFMRSDFLTELI